MEKFLVPYSPRHEISKWDREVRPSSHFFINRGVSQKSPNPRGPVCPNPPNPLKNWRGPATLRFKTGPMCVAAYTRPVWSRFGALGRGTPKPPSWGSCPAYESFGGVWHFYGRFVAVRDRLRPERTPTEERLQLPRNGVGL